MNRFDFKNIDMRKVMGTIIGGIFFISCILFFTYAFYIWTSDQTSVDLVIKDNSTECAIGPDLNVTNIGPVLSYEDSAKATFTIKNDDSDVANISLTLNITSITETLLVESFKYVIVRDNTGGTNFDYDNPILEGNFSNLAIGTNLITSSLPVAANSTYGYAFIVYIDGNVYNDPNMQGGSLVAGLSLGECGDVALNTAANYVQTLYNDGNALTTAYIGGDTNNPSVSLNAAQGIMLDNNGEYRYYGANPNNYVEFNDELWRIISVSNVKSSETDTIGEQRLRIVKAESIGKHPWDYNGSNNWETATLNDTLNGIYYEAESGTCYLNGSQTTCDYVNGTVKGLSSTARNLIDDALWYLGGTDESEGLYANDYYGFERGTSVYGNNPVTWTGNVGLIYASDYAYATDLSVCTNDGYKYDIGNCSNQDWLDFQTNGLWTLSSYNNSVYDVINYIDATEIITAYLEIHPVVVLKPDVYIARGSGTSDNPYKLSLESSISTLFLADVSSGSYVEYVGDNGCPEGHCDGTNANYVSDTDMGYCNVSSNKFFVNGWRIGYTENGSAYLVSAGAPECMCTNSDGSYSNSTCSSSETTSGTPLHLANLNNQALKYCNTEYAYGGICNSTTAWSINPKDFENITGSNFIDCNGIQSAECGYNNDLIDNGSFYWFNYNHGTPTSIALWHGDNIRRMTWTFGSMSSLGLRPVMRMDSDVMVVGGSGTYTDPYQIDI